MDIQQQKRKENTNICGTHSVETDARISWITAVVSTSV